MPYFTWDAVTKTRFLVIKFVLSNRCLFFHCNTEQVTLYLAIEQNKSFFFPQAAVKFESGMTYKSFWDSEVSGDVVVKKSATCSFSSVFSFLFYFIFTPVIIAARFVIHNPWIQVCFSVWLEPLNGWNIYQRFLFFVLAFVINSWPCLVTNTSRGLLEPNLHCTFLPIQLFLLQHHNSDRKFISNKFGLMMRA